METTGYLGIDAGTQGLSTIFADENLNVLATGEGSYDMIPGLDDGCYEQLAADWEAALVESMKDLRSKLSELQIEMKVAAIGISGQMHGEVIADESGNVVAPVRLWCDSRNAEEESELTDLFGVKMPKRITSARWLWTIRNRNELARQARHLTTPSGWMAFRLTGKWNLGIGDAAGMFPIEQSTSNYDLKLLSCFDELTSDQSVRPLRDLLPAVCRAGEDAGALSELGAKILNLETGIPVAAAEGDQPAAMAGSLIGEAGMVSVSFGTSVCANSIGDRAFQGVSGAVDHFCAADGKPINMVWLRNGTTFMNTAVAMFGEMLESDRSAGFQSIMPKLLSAAADCGGIISLPFMDDEPGLGVHRGGTGMFIGINSENAKPENLVKAALLSTMFNLRLGSEVLDKQGFPRKEIVLTGGLTKTPELAQILADVFRVPVTLPASAEEGTAWGAALLAKFRNIVLSGSNETWASFLKDHADPDTTRYEANPTSADQLDAVYAKYQRLLQGNSELQLAVHGP